MWFSTLLIHKIQNTGICKSVKHKSLRFESDLPITLFVVERTVKGCANLYNRMCKANNALISDIKKVPENAR